MILTFSLVSCSENNKIPLDKMEIQKAPDFRAIYFDENKIHQKVPGMPKDSTQVESDLVKVSAGCCTVNVRFILLTTKQAKDIWLPMII